MLAKNFKIKNKAFEQIELLNTVVEFKDKFYHSSSANLEEATKDKLKLVPTDEETIEKLKQDYKQMQDMFFQTPPDFDEILSYLSALEQDIHDI